MENRAARRNSIYIVYSLCTLQTKLQREINLKMNSLLYEKNSVFGALFSKSSFLIWQIDFCGSLENFNIRQWIKFVTLCWNTSSFQHIFNASEASDNFFNFGMKSHSKFILGYFPTFRSLRSFRSHSPKTLSFAPFYSHVLLTIFFKKCAKFENS